MGTYHLAVIPGDGIGPDVIAESLKTLDHLGALMGNLAFTTQAFDWGTDRYLRTGTMMPSDAIKTLESGGFDAILCGPVGDPRVPDHITLWGLLLPIRQRFDQYVNLRPMRLLTGVPGPLAGKEPQHINMVCVRENTEGVDSST